MIYAPSHSRPLVRWRWIVYGQVQGVGFRPAVYRVANRCGLTGFVRNDSTEVIIEAQGCESALEAFDKALWKALPRLAHVVRVSRSARPPDTCEDSFAIEASTGSGERAYGITADAATCKDCVGEMLDRDNRRFGHALITCTQCGPRFSIIERPPYDRCHTTMAPFRMCGACRREYTDPTDRRFHAQPIACPECGPVLTLVDSSGRRIGGDPIRQAVAMLNAGRIVAIKGTGGFHLSVRADDARVVGRLRQVKHRDAKPFAVMVAGIAAARRYVQLSDAAVEQMCSSVCPIILAPRHKRHGAICHDAIADNVAPGNHRLGVMLANTPIQHLLYACKRPRLACDALVMTSGNVSDEPLVIDNDEAVKRLGPMCDAILWHDRPIRRPVDDSVLLDLGSESGLLPVRRARGLAPSPISLPVKAEQPGLCVGGELKNTVAVVHDDSVIVSSHIGDLKHMQAYEYFQRSVSDLQALFDIEPAWIACDLHPAYLSTQFAESLAAEKGIPLIPVQHHHAHAAAVFAEHGMTEPAVAIVCDGVGYGEGGDIWGGEILLANLAGYRRVGALAAIRLAGGDTAARHTTRCALGLLHAALGDEFADHPAVNLLGLNAPDRDMLTRMILDNVNCIKSSAAGRVFDGVAALLGVCDFNRFEAEAPMALEAAADGIDHRNGERLYRIQPGPIERLDLSPLILYLIDRRSAGVPVSILAALFHDQLAAGLAAMARRAMDAADVNTVALSGGVFSNQRLTESVTAYLHRTGGRVLTHRRVPANDGGLAYGQAAVAAARMCRPETTSAIGRLCKCNL